MIVNRQPKTLYLIIIIVDVARGCRGMPIGGGGLLHSIFDLSPTDD